MTLHPSRYRHGGIVVETAIILTVIALLVAISVPVYRNRPDAARIAQAEQDVLALAHAQHRAADTIGYYLPLQLLDNLAPATEGGSAKADTLANEPGTLSLIAPSLPTGEQVGAQPTLGQAASALASWEGPYAETKRVYLGAADGDLSLISPESVRRDYPVDPWGTPYRFYSPEGIVGTRAAETAPEALESDEFSDGVLSAQDDRFETYAIVSYGPNGQSDSVSEQDDDIIYLFENPADSAVEGEAPEA